MGLKGIVVPLETMQNWLQEIGVIDEDVEIVRVQDSVERNAVIAIVRDEHAPNMEPGEILPLEVFYKGAVVARPEIVKPAEDGKPKVIRRPRQGIDA